MAKVIRTGRWNCDLEESIGEDEAGTARLSVSVVLETIRPNVLSWPQKEAINKLYQILILETADQSAPQSQEAQWYTRYVEA